eukprot:gene16389-25122_t
MLQQPECEKESLIDGVQRLEKEEAERNRRLKEQLSKLEESRKRREVEKSVAIHEENMKRMERTFADQHESLARMLETAVSPRHSADGGFHNHRSLPSVEFSASSVAEEHARRAVAAESASSNLRRELLDTRRRQRALEVENVRLQEQHDADQRLIEALRHKLRSVTGDPMAGVVHPHPRRHPGSRSPTPPSTYSPRKPRTAAAPREPSPTLLRQTPRFKTDHHAASKASATPRERRRLLSYR